MKKGSYDPKLHAWNCIRLQFQSQSNGNSNMAHGGTGHKRRVVTMGFYLCLGFHLTHANRIF